MSEPGCYSGAVDDPICVTFDHMLSCQLFALMQVIMSV